MAVQMTYEELAELGQLKDHQMVYTEQVEWERVAVQEAQDRAGAGRRHGAWDLLVGRGGRGRAPGRGGQGGGTPWQRSVAPWAAPWPW